MTWRTLQRAAANFSSPSVGLICLSLLPLAFAHDVISTKLLWTQEISRIVYQRCANCHREGGSAMSLMTYEEARPWAKAIRDEVISRRMPPWGAVKGVGEFRGDPSLSQIEIDMIVNWVEGGAPKGDEAY
ncbi:MAG: cytochrome c, partial [Bryobacteraceae bacterium]